MPSSLAPSSKMLFTILPIVNPTTTTFPLPRTLDVPTPSSTFLMPRSPVSQTVNPPTSLCSVATPLVSFLPSPDLLPSRLSTTSSLVTPPRPPALKMVSSSPHPPSLHVTVNLSLSSTPADMPRCSLRGWRRTESIVG